MAKNSLERYTHYYERWASNQSVRLPLHTFFLFCLVSSVSELALLYSFQIHSYFYISLEFLWCKAIWFIFFLLQSRQKALADLHQMQTVHVSYTHIFCVCSSYLPWAKILCSVLHVTLVTKRTSLALVNFYFLSMFDNFQE